ncbi:MAG: FAD-dependent oxidoreductase [Deltaproteobacteria bacterium]|nr:FAD-dependent oxidoreductase [Deltaproteobacteria bacterium]
MILVLGGGVTGLAAGRVLEAAGEDFLVLEREDEPGGWCRSIPAGKYTFDMSGHFLHVSDPVLREWILGVPGVPWREVERDARILLKGRLTPYPFQVHLNGHAPAFVSRCLADFAAQRIRAAIHGDRTPNHLAEWLIQRFGKAMCEAFFFPYNGKMWRTPLARLGYEWTDWSVPVPRFEDLLDGASGGVRKGMGYNARFHYPARGGIGALVGALARPLGARVRTGARVARIDLRRKVVHTSAGDALPYRAVISTIPLPGLAACSEGLSSSARRAASSLKWVKVLAINLGICGAGPTPGHWMYVPEPRYPFFRVGFLSNVAPSSAPRGCASVFVEKSFPANARVNVDREIGKAVRGLKRMGVLRGGSRIEELRPVMLDPGYVLFDGARSKGVSLLAGEFARRDVILAGRYGAWDYFGMDRSIADGLRAAGLAARSHGR